MNAQAPGTTERRKQVRAAFNSVAAVLNKGHYDKHPLDKLLVRSVEPTRRSPFLALLVATALAYLEGENAE